MAASLALALTLALGACGQDNHDTDTPAASSSPSGPSAPPADPADPEVRAVLAELWPDGAPGTVVVAHGEKLVHCRGMGLADRVSKVRAGCDTVYDTMSMTKQFTAAAVVKLQAQGRLRVTDPISRHLGPVPADKQKITINDLLIHTSGLPESLGDDYDKLSRDQMIEQALAATLQSRPGSEFTYSNLGFSLLAAIVEKTSGLGYEEYLSRNLFTPAGMTHTGYVLPDWGSAEVAVEYDDQGRPQGTPLEHPWANDGPYWNLRGNGGILSTARDLYRWHRALLGTTVLDTAAKRELFKPRREVSAEGLQFSQAYGWGLFPTEPGTTALHSGGNDWSYGWIARNLENDRLVFWVTNHVVRDGRWDVAEKDQELTLELLS